MNEFMVELNITGIKGTVFVKVSARSIGQAIAFALESVSSIKQNDCGIESISMIVEEGE